MYLKENEKAIQVIKWIRKDATNALIWDILCGDSWFEYTIEDCIDMLEKTAEAEMQGCVNGFCGNGAASCQLVFDTYGIKSSIASHAPGMIQ